jgi:protein AroM
VGLVTVGQSPRTDVVPDIAVRLPPGTPLFERGALDAADAESLARLAPRHGEAVLVSRMRDGSEVAVSEHRLMPLVQAAVDDVTGRGAAVVAVLCTGALAGLRCPRPLLQPGLLVRNLVMAAGGARLGVLVPAPVQVEAVRADWLAVTGGPADTVLVLAASPYGPPGPLRQAAARLADWRPDLVVLDCLGFDGAMQQIVAQATGAPVILPRTALAGAVATLL